MVTLIGYVLVVALGFVVYFMAKSKAEWRSKYIATSTALRENVARIAKMQEDQRELENRLVEIREGTPRERVDASVDILRDVSKRTRGTSAPRVARTRRTSGNNPA